MATFKEIEIPNDPDAPDAREGGPPPRGGVRRAILTFLVAVALMPLPYAITAAIPEPGPCEEPEVEVEGAALPQEDPCCGKKCVLGVDVEEAVLWRPGDPLPFSESFGLGEDEAAEEAAERARELEARAAAPPSPIVEVEPVAPVKPAAPPKGSPDATTPDSDATAPDAGPTEPVEPARPPRPIVRIPDELWEGAEVLIDDPKGGMEPFYRALEHTVLEKGVTRVAHWGDSVIAADGLTHAARRRLQATFGDAGRGFVLVSEGNEWYRPQDVTWREKGWRTANVLMKQASDGHYGFGFVSSSGYTGARAFFGTTDDAPVNRRVSRFQILFPKGPNYGQLELRLDGGEPELIDLNADTLTDAEHVVEVPDGPHELKIRAMHGLARVYGVALERDVPGVVYDAVGLIGGRIRRLTNADPEHVKRQLAFRQPDLIVLMFGGNSLVGNRSMKSYEEGFREGVRLFRNARPEAGCLIISPVDHGKKIRRRARTPQRLIDMMEVQKRVAFEEGCAWWSAFDAMGGRDSMAGWVKQGLGEGDYSHLTVKGAMVMGELYFKALMKGFADWLAR